MSGDGDDRGSSRFGGAWTERKLATLRKYLQAFTTALKKKPNAGSPFELWYVDAFAGSGHRAELRHGGPALFSDDIEAVGLRKGSVQIALETAPRFHRFLFIDRDEECCTALRRLTAERGELKEDVEIRCGDANVELEELCAESWRARRAVVFLDPFATEVHWSTLEAIAKTRAMDTWILFPLMAVNRMLTTRGKIPGSWSKRIDDVFGTPGWRDRIYAQRPSIGLFGQDETELFKRRIEEIGKYFLERLKGIFAGVAERTKILTNSTNSPLFLLCFAAASPSGAKTAIKIANDLMKGID
jgi:three-Cys-motif partner protein